jgi:hypothetical protein
MNKLTNKKCYKARSMGVTIESPLTCTIQGRAILNVTISTSVSGIMIEKMRNIVLCLDFGTSYSVVPPHAV